ncbi:MAG: type II toxin-antitoxin system PemK/MazF family toxin [Ilumatobacteraceae bacterium]
MEWGELRWTDAGAGGRRPVLILTRPEALPYMRQVIVAPLTTTIRGLPSEVELDQRDGVRRPCAVNLDSIQLVSRDQIGRRIGVLGVAKLEEVRRALLRATGFAP